MKALSPFLVGVSKQNGQTTTDGGGEPNFQFYRGVTPPNFANFDNDHNVHSWAIMRRTGPIEFSDQQIWDAVIQHQKEFRSMYEIGETREEFQARDPIGYSETMAGMERVLYKALGYY
jgi:hypothetical protein